MSTQASALKSVQEEKIKKPAAKPSVQATAFALQGSPATLQRAVVDPRSARPAEILALQRQCGNIAVQRLLAGHLLPDQTQSNSTPAATPVIQRLTADDPPGLHHDTQPVVNVVHSVAETITNASGVESDTGSFAHQNGSQYLEGSSNPLPVIYKSGGRRSYHVANVVTKGGDGNSLVKMHLVNSYLNPDANNWPDNWVWGSQTLNHQHNEIEEKAKQAHPDKAPENLSLNYETQALTARPAAGDNADRFITKLAWRIEQACNRFAGSTRPDNAALRANTTIAGENIDTFIGHWQAALNNTATTGVKVNYRVLAKNSDGKWGATTSDSRSAAEVYEVHLTEGRALETLAASLISEERTPRKRVVSQSPPVQSPNKKLKSTR